MSEGKRSDPPPESAVETIYRLARGGRDGLRVAEPTAAVTVVLWRCAPGDQPGAGEVQLYLGKRAPTMKFLPGMWTFPGGAIGPGDRDMAIVGASGQRALELAAGIREIREETGLALAPEAERFMYLGRLITPEFSPMRFDAAIYLVKVGADEVVDHRVSGEFVDGVWIAPSAALSRPGSGQWLIPEPTRSIVRAFVPGLDRITERCLAACAQLNDAVRAYPLIPGIQLSPVRTPTLPPATTTTCYIVGADELIVIDPASPYDAERTALDEALAALRARGRHVVEIWLTHHHGDHVSGAAHLAERLGVPVAAHRLTAERVAHRVRVDRYLEDGEVRDLAGEPARRVRVVFTPGHAPGHICILEEHSGFLIAGDMVAGVGSILIEPTDGDMHLYLESLRRMRALCPSALLPAHGPMILDPEAKIDEYIKHRLWREERVIEAMREAGPAPARALVPHAYADVPPMIWPLAERSLIAHLYKLERDGAATCTDGAGADDPSVWQLV